MSHSHSHGNHNAKTSREWAVNFAEVFAYKMHAATTLILSTERKMELVGKICAFAALDCRKPLPAGVGQSGVSYVLDESRDIFLSLREDIRSLGLQSSLEAAIIDIAEKSDHIARYSMDGFRQKREEVFVATTR